MSVIGVDGRDFTRVMGFDGFGKVTILRIRVAMSQVVVRVRRDRAAK
jgi:hypothetical protein